MVFSWFHETCNIFLLSRSRHKQKIGLQERIYCKDINNYYVRIRQRLDLYLVKKCLSRVESKLSLFTLPKVYAICGIDLQLKRRFWSVILMRTVGMLQMDKQAEKKTNKGSTNI